MEFSFPTKRTHMGTTTVFKVVETPMINRPKQNIASFTEPAAMAVPNTLANAAMTRPHFLPHLFGIQPAMGTAKTLPIDEMAIFNETNAVEGWKNFQYPGRI